MKRSLFVHKKAKNRFVCGTLPEDGLADGAAVNTAHIRNKIVTEKD